jgi:plastocyanin
LTAASLQAAEINGVIHVTHRLTKRPVIPVTASYHRGVTVETGAAEQDFARAELERVAVYLDNNPRLRSEPATAILKQQDRRFLDETIVVPVGSTVSFPNLDPIFHNVFSLSRVRSFDLGNYRQNETRTVTFPKPGIVRVYCHLHPNMSASIVVTPNVWATKPAGDGQYRLTGVPAGEYSLVVWHKSAGFFRKTIHVDEGQPVRADFTIPIGEDAQTAVDQ